MTFFLLEIMILVTQKVWLSCFCLLLRYIVIEIGNAVK